MFLLFPPLSDPCQPTGNASRLKSFVFNPVFSIFSINYVDESISGTKLGETGNTGWLKQYSRTPNSFGNMA